MVRKGSPVRVRKRAPKKAPLRRGFSFLGWPRQSMRRNTRGTRLPVAYPISEARAVDSAAEFPRLDGVEAVALVTTESHYRQLPAPRQRVHVGDRDLPEVCELGCRQQPLRRL